MTVLYNQDQLLLTNQMMHCITANMLQTNQVDARCDNLRPN